LPFTEFRWYTEGESLNFAIQIIDVLFGAANDQQVMASICYDYPAAGTSFVPDQPSGRPRVFL